VLSSWPFCASRLRTVGRPGNGLALGAIPGRPVHPANSPPQWLTTGAADPERPRRPCRALGSLQLAEDAVQGRRSRDTAGWPRDWIPGDLRA